MNCPFCKTHIDQHAVNRCADAWIATLLHKPKNYDFVYCFGKGLYITDLNVFMAEVMPEINKDHFINIFQEKGIMWYCSVFLRTPTSIKGSSLSEGKTINEALFRAVVKVLSKGAIKMNDETKKRLEEIKEEMRTYEKTSQKNTFYLIDLVEEQQAEIGNLRAYIEHLHYHRHNNVEERSCNHCGLRELSGYRRAVM